MKLTDPEFNELRRSFERITDVIQRATLFGASVETNVRLHPSTGPTLEVAAYVGWSDDCGPKWLRSFAITAPDAARRHHDEIVATLVRREGGEVKRDRTGAFEDPRPAAD